MRSVRYGCSRTRSASAWPSGPRLSQMLFGTPSRPRSWTSPARRIWPAAGSPSPYAVAACMARSATPREWPRVYRDFTSAKSAIASSAESNASPVSRIPSAGSALSTASQLLASSSPANRDAAHLANTSTISGSNCVPRRCLATSTAACVPSARWNTSTTSASVIQARGDENVCAARSLRHALAVPPLEGLLDAVAHPLRQAELRRQRVRRPPVVLQHRVGGPAPVADEGDSEPGPFRERPVGAEVAQDEQGPVGLGGEVGPAKIGLERGVVAEPLRLLVRVNVAAHPGDERGVVHHFAVPVRQVQVLGQSQRDQRLAQHVLHRLAHAEVSRQRQDGQQFGQVNAVAVGGLGHDPNASSKAARPATPTGAGHPAGPGAAAGSGGLWCLPAASSSGIDIGCFHFVTKAVRAALIGSSGQRRYRALCFGNAVERT